MRKSSVLVRIEPRAAAGALVLKPTLSCLTRAGLVDGTGGLSFGAVAKSVCSG